MKTILRHTIHAAMLLAAASVILAGCENLLGGGSNGGDSGNSENDDGSGGGDTVPFITTWQTDASGDDTISADNEIQLPLDEHGSYNFTVEWGDGTQDHITAWDQWATRHIYPSVGTYTITISGLIAGFGFGYDDGSGNSDADKLLDVKQWGPVTLRNDELWEKLSCRATAKRPCSAKFDRSTATIAVRRLLTAQWAAI